MNSGIIILKRELSVKLGFEIRTQSDVKYLRNMIFEETNLSVGFSTLRRFYNLLPNVNPQKKTLDSLSVFLGYLSYSDFLKKINSDKEWVYWSLVNNFENKQSLSEGDLAELYFLKTNPHYTLFLSSILKAFLRRKNYFNFKKVLAAKYLFESIKENNLEVMKLAFSVGCVLGTLTRKEYVRLVPLLSNKYVFKTIFLDFYVDYTHLKGYYGFLVSERLKIETDLGHIIFLNLILHYHTYLKGSDNFKLYKPKLPKNIYPVLHGRLLGYQLLTTKIIENKPTDKFLEKIFKIAQPYPKALFFIEMIPVLILVKALDAMELITTKYYEDLFASSPWSYYTSQYSYLIAFALVDIKNGKYNLAAESLSFIDFDKAISTSHHDYVKLLYCIVSYQLEKYTTKDNVKLQKISLEYTSLVKVTGFKRFTKQLLLNYFE